MPPGLTTPKFHCCRPNLLARKGRIKDWPSYSGKRSFAMDVEGPLSEFVEINKSRMVGMIAMEVVVCSS